MKNLKLILTIAGSLLVSLFFWSFGLYMNQYTADFQRAISDGNAIAPNPLSVFLARWLISLVSVVAITLFIGFLVVLVKLPAKLSAERKEKILKEIVIIGWVFIAIALFPLTLYFLPTIIAWKRKHRNLMALFILNLLLGAVFGVGWVIALVWALLNEPNSVVSQTA